MTPEQAKRLQQIKNEPTSSEIDLKADVLFLLEVLAEAQESNKRLEGERDHENNEYHKLFDEHDQVLQKCDNLTARVSSLVRQLADCEAKRDKDLAEQQQRAADVRALVAAVEMLQLHPDTELHHDIEDHINLMVEKVKESHGE